MSNTVLLKKSGVASRVPQLSDLSLGEIALNYKDGYIYYRDNETSPAVHKLDAGNADTIGGESKATMFTDPSFTGDLTVSGSLDIDANNLQLIENTIGSLSTVFIELEVGNGSSNLKSGETIALNWNADGVALTSGARVNEIETTLTNDDAHIPTSGAVIDYVDSHSHIETTPVTVITGTGGETYSRYKSDVFTKDQIEAITFDIEAVKLGSEVPSIGSRWLINSTDLKMVDVGNITTIPFNAFKNCSALEQVIIRNNTSVGQFAFAGCTSLTNLDLGRVETINNNSFDGCTALETVTIPDSLVDDNSFGDETFKGCTALANINCYATYNAFGQNPTGNRLLGTSTNLTIHAKPNTGWTAGTNLSIQGNASVDVILDLV